MQHYPEFYQEGVFKVDIPHTLSGDADYEAYGASIGEDLLENGGPSLAQVAIDLKRLQKILEGFYKVINEDSRRALDAYIGQELIGARIEKGSIGSVRYDYTPHPMHAVLKERCLKPIKDFEERLKVAGKIFESKKVLGTALPPMEFKVPGSEELLVFYDEDGSECTGYLPEEVYPITPETAAIKIGEKTSAAIIKL